MDIQPSLNHLARELRRRGLPPAYIARYLAELDEHITDLIEERRSGMSKDALTDAQVAAQIGDPMTLADAASVEFARRGFCGQHPIIMFLVAPIPLALLAWAATFAASFGLVAAAAAAARWLGVGPGLGDSAASWPPAAIWVLPMLLVLSVAAPPAALTVLLCRLARRNGLGWRWSLAGCLMVALAAAMFHAGLDLPTAPGTGRLTLGLGMWAFPPTQQMLQFALPLTIGLGLLWRETRRHTGGPHATPGPSMEYRQAA